MVWHYGGELFIHSSKHKDSQSQTHNTPPEYPTREYTHVAIEFLINLLHQAFSEKACEQNWVDTS